ncbi:MAG TPA: rRNA maturation RNase YbeY [Bacteroidia bacterium]|nr:rRNA maturation RNase YbeY [Bacteroidia bacterium]
MAITFSASLKTKTPSKKKLKLWLAAIAFSEKRKIKNLAYNFCSDEELLQINQGFLKHNTYTDIITFDYCADGFIVGEIYISVERVAENAEKLKTVFEEELLRVIAHGLLHLCGYKDKKPEHQKKMRSAENRAIKLFKTISD